MVAFTIIRDIPSRWLVMTNVTPSWREDINSYQSELGGLYGVVTTVKQVVAWYNITDGQIEVGSNCLVGLQWVFTNWHHLLHLEKHHNLVSAMCKKIG